jgi:hypothetical protein
MGEIAAAVPGVHGTDPVRDQQLDRLPDQFGPAVPEQPLSLGIDQADPPILGNPDDRVRRRFQQAAELRLRADPVADIPDRR